MFRRLTIAAVLLLIACRQPETSQASLVIDDDGRPVSITGPVSRIVSLSPGHTELLFALGAGERVVGRTRWGDYPPAVVSIPSVGDGLEPNIEVIVAQRPDLVVFYSSPANASAIARLDELGIASVSLRTDRLADLARAAHTLGQLLGDTLVAETLVVNLERDVAALRRDAPAGRRPSVMILAWDNPPIVIGRESFLSEIVELAGARNTFADVDAPSLTVTLETIAARDPDYVLLTSDTGTSEWANRPEWQSVAAVRDRMFIVVSGSEFGRPSFRAPAAVRRLQDALSAERQ